MYKGLQAASNCRVLFLDMNSFFASVEQQYRPELRGKPMAVVSHSTGNGTVLAASYEAKAFGIRTGTKNPEARTLCPGIVLVEPNQYRYRDMHDRFIAIMKDVCGPEVVAYSIDEAGARLSVNWQTSEKAHALASLIKTRFITELGPAIHCSIGIAPNTFLAKVATDLQKPNGLVEITLENLEKTLSKLQLTDLPGIAHRGAATFELHNIHTPLDLYNTPNTQLRAWFGIAGQYWWWKLHGFETESDHEKPHHSISHEHVLPRWIQKREEAAPIVMRMADRLIHRLRRNNYQTKLMWLHLSHSQALGLFAERKFDSPTNSYPILIKTVSQLLRDLPPSGGALRKITIGFGAISQAENNMQLDLFETTESNERISSALELIRRRHGFGAIQTGFTVGLNPKLAKEQLGFGRLKDRSLTALSPKHHVNEVGVRK